MDRGKRKKPVVIVGRIRNETMEHINTSAFVADLEHILINSDKVSFVVGDRDRDKIRLERLDQLSNASEETINQIPWNTDKQGISFNKKKTN